MKKNAIKNIIFATLVTFLFGLGSNLNVWSIGAIVFTLILLQYVWRQQIYIRNNYINQKLKILYEVKRIQVQYSSLDNMSLYRYWPIQIHNFENLRRRIL